MTVFPGFTLVHQNLYEACSRPRRPFFFACSSLNCRTDFLSSLPTPAFQFPPAGPAALRPGNDTRGVGQSSPTASMVTVSLMFKTCGLDCPANWNRERNFRHRLGGSRRAKHFEQNWSATATGLPHVGQFMVLPAFMPRSQLPTTWEKGNLPVKQNGLE